MPSPIVVPPARPLFLAMERDVAGAPCHVDVFQADIVERQGDIWTTDRVETGNWPTQLGQ